MKTPTSRFGMYPPALARELEKASTATEEAARAAYWRLQGRMEAMPLEEYEGPKGDRLNTVQAEYQARVAELCGDPHWHERSA